MIIYLSGFILTFIILTFYVSRVLGNDIDGASLASILVISAMSWGALLLSFIIYLILNFKPLLKKSGSKVILKGKRR